MNLWPPCLYVYLSQRRAVLTDVSAWVRRHRPPVCAFMPDRLPDPTTHTANQASFASFSRLLLENQLVCKGHSLYPTASDWRSHIRLVHWVAFAPWNAPDRLPGAGVMIYPTSSLTSFSLELSSCPDNSRSLSLIRSHRKAPPHNLSHLHTLFKLPTLYLALQPPMAPQLSITTRTAIARAPWAPTPRLPCLDRLPG